MKSCSESFDNLTQTGVLWEAGALIEELPPPDWPVGMYGKAFS